MAQRRAMRRTAIGAGLALGLLGACQQSGQDGADAPAADPGGLPATATLDWTMTPWGPCVATPPAVAFLPVAECEAPTALPGYPFAAIPYLGTLLAAGNAAAASDYSDCAGGSASAMIHNRQAAYLLAQQCMDAADIAAMQRGLRGLGLLAAAEAGRIDEPTFGAMRAWHAGYHTGDMEIGPTREFGARVVESAQAIAGIDGAAAPPPYSPAGRRAPFAINRPAAPPPPGAPLANPYGQPNPYAAGLPQ